MAQQENKNEREYQQGSHPWLFLTSFQDLRKRVRNSKVSTRLTCHSTDHTAVSLTYLLPPNDRPQVSSKKKNNHNKSHLKTCKRRTKKNLLPEDPNCIKKYNHKVKELIDSWKQEHKTEQKDQPSLTVILKEGSKNSFPNKKASRNEWFNKDEENLINLISIKNKNEKKIQYNNTTKQLSLCHKLWSALKKAIKKQKKPGWNKKSPD